MAIMFTLIIAQNVQNIKNKQVMNEKEIKQVFDDIQQQLEILLGSDASFMFIGGHQGNHFVIGGKTNEISAQILFAMMRYPVIRDIIKECAARYDDLNAEYGSNVRDVKMDHLIEQNSGNGN